MKNNKLLLSKTILIILLFTQFSTACVRVKKDKTTDSKSYVENKSFYVIGYSLKTSFENDKYEKDLERLWNYFEADFDAQLFHSRSNDKIYLVMYNYDDSESGNFEVLLGYNVENPNPQQKSKYATIQIPKAKFYTVNTNGTDDDDVVAGWEKISSSKINRNFKYDFEVYSLDEDFEVANIEIFVSVEDK